MTRCHTPRNLRMPLLVLAAVMGSLVGLCAISPLGNTLIVRPILANFDSRYVSSVEYEPLPFDPDSWRAGKARHRVGMARYLADTKLLDGKTRAEVVAMLGEPDIDRPGDEGMRWLVGFYAKGLF